ncbi:hypothetical protein RRG08_042546 [Elysia crispata]|uniref:Uncharacterized protein n=1 Tax=Elysia crispata TaxID=231223 RepID=A0AAE0XQ95_9GAST|nr:hypothetical protein RRG08_042546 [Elysia crispata]
MPHDQSQTRISQIKVKFRRERKKVKYAATCVAATKHELFQKKSLQRARESSSFTFPMESDSFSFREKCERYEENAVDLTCSLLTNKAQLKCGKFRFAIRAVALVRPHLFADSF